MPVAAAADHDAISLIPGYRVLLEKKMELISGAANSARGRTVGLTHTRTSSGPVRGIEGTGVSLADCHFACMLASGRVWWWTSRQTCQLRLVTQRHNRMCAIHRLQSMLLPG